MIETVPFRESDVVPAAALVAARYGAARAAEPHLPADFEDAEPVAVLLRNWVRVTSGFVAVQEGRMLGFMLGLVTPWEGAPAAWVPDVCHGATDADPAAVYHQLYAACATVWIERGCLVHHVSVLEADRAGREAFDALGFGTFAVDALRAIDPPIEPPIESLEEIGFRKADPESDLASVMKLQRSLVHHLRAAPIFLPIPAEPDVEKRRAWLARSSHTMWLATRGAALVAAVGCEPPQPLGLCTSADRTVAITFACTSDTERRTGVATALASRVLEQARAEGCVRCTVDFESANLDAVRFWSSLGFETVSRTMRRRIDPRVSEAH